MPKLGWITPHPAPEHGRVLVMASRFELTSRRHVPAFLARSLASWKQVKAAPGAYGAALDAQPLRAVFWTLSAWHDRESLYRYAKTDPHGDAVRAMRPMMWSFTHVFWETDAGGLPIGWDEAKRRLAVQQGTGETPPH
ncbi:MAG TPA: DUF3291 domain-containing protein [Yinghuangia sp.]|nr:DUF3291 domain-containing protein [Yinghuangia sp.]